MASKINITELYNDYFDKSGEQENNINTFVAKSILYVIHNIFLKSAAYFVLTLCCRNPHTCNFYNDLLQRIFNATDKSILQLVNIPKNDTLYVPGQRNHNLLLIDSYKGLLDVNITSYSADYNHNEIYYIFLQARDHLLKGEMQKIFEYCWANYIINCNVQIQNRFGDVLVYTYFPFTAKNCRQVEVVLVNRFDGSSFVSDQLFPSKLKNFHRCPLTAALWDVPPFLSLVTDSNGKHRITGGLEGELLLELSARLNFTLDIIIPANDEQRGIVKKNNELTGAMKLLRDRDADLSLGSFRHAVERISVVGYTSSYYQTYMSFMVMKSAYALNSMEILIFPFRLETWGLIAVLAAWCILSIRVVNTLHFKHRYLFEGYRPSLAYLNLLLLSIGMPAILNPQRYYSRLFYVMWMFFTLILRTAYQALLFHIIRTNATNRLPRDFEDLVKDNYTAVMNRATYASVRGIEHLRYLTEIMIDSSSETIAFEYLEEVASKRWVAAGPFDFMMHHIQSQHRAGWFKVLDEHIVSFPITMYLSRHSFLTDYFNEEILWMRVTGFMGAWQNKNINRNYVSGGHTSEDKLFGLRELYMVFVIYLIGMACATIVFLFEVLTIRKCWHVLRKRLWRLLNRNIFKK